MLSAQIQELQTLVPALPSYKAAFALSLLSQYTRKGTLSVNQIPHVAKLIDFAKNPGAAQAAQPVNVGNLSGLIALFQRGGAKLKWPKIRLNVNGLPLVLSVAGPRSKAPGSINIAGEGGWSDRAWYGRVSPQGQFDPSRSTDAATLTALVAVLNQLSSDPVAAVQAYGKLTGQCMFCGLKLTDGRSTAAGFGETCAKNWGLHNEWKTAAANVN